MRIGLVGPLPPPAGGMANQTRLLSGLLRQEGACVEVVQTNAPYRPAWVGSLRGLRAVARLVPYVFRIWRAAGKAQVFHIMANSGWSWHLFAAPAIWIAVLRHVPVVVNYRGGEAQAFLEGSFRWVRPTLARAAAVTVPSGFLQQVFAHWGIHTEIVPNIVELERFSYSGDFDTALLECPHIVVARNLEPIYDVESALRAFKLIRAEYAGAQLSIAGGGAEALALRSLADELGITDGVTFTGPIDNERMGDLYQFADVMLNPSLADNMPISVLEAMASGIPVVSTRVGGVPYLIDDGITGVLVPARDYRAMADAILKLLENPSLRRTMVKAAHEYVQQFTWARVRHRLDVVYGAVRNDSDHKTSEENAL